MAHEARRVAALAAALFGAGIIIILIAGGLGLGLGLGGGLAGRRVLATQGLGQGHILLDAFHPAAGRLGLGANLVRGGLFRGRLFHSHLNRRGIAGQNLARLSRGLRDGFFQRLGQAFLGRAALLGNGELAGPALGGACGLALLLLGLLAGLGLLHLDQFLAIGHRNLIVIRVDFRKRQEAMAIATILHEGGLQAGLHPNHFGQVDIALQGKAIGRLEVEFLKP